ncbi:MAG: hypothetical protein ACLGIJ_01845 [Candidatus Limnocylindria bacterium]
MRRLIGALASAIVIAAVAAGGVFATHAITGDTVAPKANSHMYVAGNPRCGAAAEGGFNLKIEAEDLGVGNYGPIRITYFNGKYVSWEIRAAYLHTYDADTVIVKGGPNAIIYQYSKTDGVWPDTNEPDDSDTRLTAPRNPNGAQPKYYGISHIQFCFDPKA